VSASMGWCVIWLPLLMRFIACRPGEQRPPRVVIIPTDTLNRNALRCFAENAPPLPAIAGPHWYIRERWGDELYDMRRDRWQRRNLAPEEVDLDVHRRLVARCFGPQAAPNPVETDEELAGQLRSLGYVD
jgi:hypothetical protein